MAEKKSLNELLKWSIINQATEKEDASPRSSTIKPMEKMDPGLIEAILGKSESQMMLEALQVIKNPHSTDDEKDLAWEDFEMLIQQIDNACNVENMKMWPPILEELKSTNPKYREQAAWVCGTATQNNPKAQAAFLKEGGIQPVIGLLADPEPYVRAKAIYALSGAIKHFEPALEEFKAVGGYKTLVDILKTDSRKSIRTAVRGYLSTSMNMELMSNQLANHAAPFFPSASPALIIDLTLVRKVVFLMNTLLIQDPSSSSALVDLELIQTFGALLKKHMDDEDLVEKTLVALKTFFDNASTPVPSATLDSIRPQVLEAKEKYADYILDKASWADLEKRIA
ncbi:hsp70 nucleotide exchange factor fes1 [Linnemannia hyalina]|uniref:Hsp70 nucleotide exchange factor fes1 n=1 Tax=Linnemannia hyalina TaxID=64524 RepID=A0A9P7XUU0_9FUNG|nr:hsp70 nucleotide exchange factor fes1 [Linnemannia hyalina]